MAGIKLKIDAGSAKKAERQMKSSFSAISRAAKSTEKTLSRMGSGLGKGLKSVSSHLFSLKTLLAGAATGWAADKFMDVASSFEQMGLKLNALTDGKGAETLKEINDWAMKMPVNTQKAVDTFAMMKAMGLDPTIDSMQTLVDVSVIFRENAMPRVARALGQMQTLGKLSAEELNQLSEAGINARKYLKKAFGTSNAQEINKTGVEIEKVISVITEGLKEDFGGAAESAMNTWTGVKNEFSSIITEMTKMLADSGVFSAVKDGIREISKVMGDWMKHQKELVSANLPNFFSKIGDSVKKIVPYIKGLIGGLQLLSGGELRPELDATDMNRFSKVAANAALAVLSLAQGLLKIKDIWANVKESFHSLKAWSNEKDASMWGGLANVFSGKKDAKMFRGLQRSAGEVALESRGAAAIAAEESASIRAQSAEIQKLMDSMSSGITSAHDKTKNAATEAKEQIEKVVRIIDGKPVAMYINIKPAMKDLDRLENRVKKMKLSLNVNMTGTASSRKPLTEKITDILDLYKKFPTQMKFGVDMTSLSGAYAALEKIPAKMRLYEMKKGTAESSRVSLLQGVAAQSTPVAQDNLAERQSQISRSIRRADENLSAYSSIREGIQQLISSGYYGDGGSRSMETSPTTARLNIGPVNVSVSGTGGDRDLAITLADEMDHEIAQKIIHNRSEITAALGISNVSN
jgi:tape measure domain-containing protein